MNVRSLSARRWLVAASAASSVVVAGCASGEPPAFRTVPGPDTYAVLANVPGQLAVAHAGDDLPCDWLQPIARRSDRSCLLFAPPDRPSGVGGVVPENEHSILVLRIDRDPVDRLDVSFALVRRRCAAAQRACRPVEERIASWKAGKGGARYRKTLALSPDGRWLALLPASSLIRMNGFAPPAPDGYHFANQRDVGEMVLVDLRTGAVRNTGIDIVDDEPISWSSDGRRLLVVRAETIDRLTPAMREELRGREGEAGKPIPVIESWDVDGGAVQMLAIGFRPLWSPDRRFLLYAPVRVAQVEYYAGADPTLRRAASDAFVLRDLDTGVQSEVSLPGLVGPRGPIAFVGERKILYWGWPVVHTPPRMTVRNSPLIGPKQMMALKVGDLETREAGTVLPWIDPRARVGFFGRP